MRKARPLAPRCRGCTGAVDFRVLTAGPAEAETKLSFAALGGVLFDGSLEEILPPLLRRRSGERSSRTPAERGRRAGDVPAGDRRRLAPRTGAFLPWFVLRARPPSTMCHGSTSLSSFYRAAFRRTEALLRADRSLSSPTAPDRSEEPASLELDAAARYGVDLGARRCGSALGAVLRLLDPPALLDVAVPLLLCASTVPGGNPLPRPRDRTMLDERATNALYIFRRPGHVHPARSSSASRRFPLPPPLPAAAALAASSPSLSFTPPPATLPSPAVEPT